MEQTQQENTEVPADGEIQQERVIEITAEQSAKFYSKLVSREEITRTRKELKIDFRELTEHNVGQLRALLDRTLPVTYHEDFYNRLTSFQRYSKLAYFKDILIGAVTCKDDKRQIGQTGDKQPGVYIMTITVFDKYRRYGIASKLLEKAIEECCKNKKLQYIFLDVQENNLSALEFYKNHGFVVSHLNEGYYTNIEPSNSYFLYKKIDIEVDASQPEAEASTDAPETTNA